jgi:hypothetical protein
MDGVKLDFTNQQLTITQQLDLGIRHLMLDVHYIADTAWSDLDPQKEPLRVCHSTWGACSDFSNKLPDNFKSFTSCKSLFGFVDYGVHQGCTFTSPSFAQIMSEIQTWMCPVASGECKNDVVIVDIEDLAGDDPNSGTTGRVNAVLSNDKIKNLIFTKDDLSAWRASAKQSTGWPSTKDIVGLGKRLVFHVPSESKFLDPYCHHLELTIDFPLNLIKTFNPTTCNAGNTPINPADHKFAYFQESSIYIYVDLPLMGGVHFEYYVMAMYLSFCRRLKL